MLHEQNHGKWKVQALSDALGAKVVGLDLSQPLDAGTVKEIEDLWHAYGVLCFPDQSLTDLEQVRFAGYFGELATTRVEYESGKGSHPAVMYVTNEKKDGQYVGALPDGEMYFHSDMCYMEKPVKATLLYAMNIPKVGGNTYFANMYAAYEALSPALRERLQGLKALNIYEQGTADTTTLRTRSTALLSASALSYTHPVVCTHPATGRKALFVNRLMTARIEGMPREESNGLLESLFDHQEQPQFVYEHVWSVGDLLMWDNRCVLHARGDFSAESLRKLRRVTVNGDVIA